MCVIGAGSSGIAAVQVLRARGLEVDCFEIGSSVGGNWRYRNDNGMSSAYRSLHINTSRDAMAYATFPMPKHYPDYPGHALIARYFDDYVDHFAFRDRIRFRTEVTSVEPEPDGCWRVHYRHLDSGEKGSRSYAAVLVANGHHWKPRWPEPPFPGADEFTGEQLHAHHYTEPDVLVGKRVLVLGIGNSAADIAVESSRNAEATFLAMRRGAWVMPKYAFGRPTDELQSAALTRLPLALQRLAWKGGLLVAGKPTKYGLPAPDHKLMSAHPTVSSDLLPRIGHGDISVKPTIERFTGGRTVRFADGSEEEIDLVVYCTGYQISFPFLERSIIDPAGNHVHLYRRVVHPERPGLYFIGLAQPLGAIMPIAEAQAEWVADLVAGEVRLPGVPEMQREIRKDEAAMARRYVASARHTIQVDFHPYLRSLRRERRRHAVRR